MSFPEIPDNIYKYSTLFNYDVWTPNSSVKLCNVPWDASYRDVVRFDSAQAQADYFVNISSQTTTLSRMSILKFGEPVLIDVPYNTALAYNYCVVVNPLAPVPKEQSGARTTYYYFITDMEYVAPNTTRCHVMLDVFQTFAQNLQFGRCYVERGHVAISASLTGSAYDQRRYLTVSEGVEHGAEYQLCGRDFVTLQDSEPGVGVYSTASLQNAFGDVSKQNLNTSSGGSCAGMPSGAEAYIMSYSEFQKLMNALQGAPWVAQCITAIYMIPGRFAKWYIDNASVSLAGGAAHAAALCNGDTADMGLIFEESFLDSATDDKWNITKTYKNGRYKNLLKLNVYPYSIIEVTANSGNALIVKPELLPQINSDYKHHLIFELVGTISQPNPKAYAYLKYYNAVADQPDTKLDFYRGAKKVDYTFAAGEFLDFALSLYDFPQCSIVTNQYLNYMASNANEIRYSFQSADWSQQKALQSASNSYDNSMISARTGLQNTGLSTQNAANVTAMNNAFSQRNWMNSAIANGSTAVSSGLASGNPAGAAVGVLNMGIGLEASYFNNQNNQAQATAQTAMSNNLANSVASNNYGAQSAIAGNNVGLATWAAQGDYANQIAGIQAKLNDAKLTQPSSAGMTSGSAFQTAYGLVGMLVNYKCPDYNTLNTLGEYFLRYGYSVNEDMVPPNDLKVCENFSYWKMLSVYIVNVNIPETYKQTIRGILEKGVTVWSNPALIGNVDYADNEPIRGVWY